MKPCRQSAFTLVEMLVVVTVLGVLLAMVAAAVDWGTTRARMAREISAARTLVAAYSAATADNAGRLLPGYDDDASGYQTPGGGSISSAAAHRYPFRLAPYFDYAIDGVILVNRNKSQIVKMAGDSTYFRSLFPALGMNVSYVGGRVERGKVADAQDCITNMAQVGKASMTLVFASARYGSGKEKVDGFHELVPPNRQARLWTGGDTADDKSPDNFGHVDFRYSGQAVCAFLDGSVRMMTPKVLKDMRYWNRNAQLADNADYTVPIEGPPPGRGSGR